MDGISRRQFLAVSAGGFATYALRHNAAAIFAQEAKKTAKACIVLWMDGGPSQLDTFDPKPGRPNGGKFKAIETSAKDITVTEHLHRTAKWMHKGAVIRTVNTEEQDHGRGAYLMHTGYKPAAAVTHPSFGSIVAVESRTEPGVPGYVAIRNSGAFAFANAGGPGFLGPQAAPFVIDKPEKPDETIRALGERLKERIDLLEDLNKDFRAERPSENSEGRQAMLEAARNVKDSVFARALDLRGLPEDALARYVGENKDRYVGQGAYAGPASQFGYGCLLAKRLVAAGVRFVEVNLGGWDTHANNFAEVKGLLGIVDPALSAMLEDLDKDGLLDSTLVAWMGEFGRTPQINAGQGRDHWPTGYSVALWGGGVGGGRVHGETDADGVKIVKDPTPVADVFATMAQLLSIDPNKRYIDRDVGAVRVTDNGKPIKALVS
jgi:hypothetical protein